MRHLNVSLFVPHLGCPHTCIFCDQRAISGESGSLTPDQIVAACETARNTPHDRANSEIAFFGGSFTAVDRETQELCLKTAAPYLETDFGGIRISTRPDAIDEEELTFLKRYGVTSIELGAQSMDARVLALNERGHTPEDTERACDLIRKHGFSLGLQMMTGLYGSTKETDLETARRFRSLSPDTVRIYPTVVLEGTKLAEKYRQGLYVPPTMDEQISLCAELLELFTECGIRVIRLGLHAGGDVEQKRLAGAYHPAFRELVESRIYRTRLEEALKRSPAGHYIINIGKGETSKAVGQKRENVRYFAQRGYALQFRETEKNTHGMEIKCEMRTAPDQLIEKL